VTSTIERSCVDCASPSADLPIVLETGVFAGWICRECDRTRRHKRGGWKGKVRRYARRYGA
jgi:hypothetical protein